MTSSAAQIHTYSGPAILSFGFRPFFLLAGAWTVVSMALSAAMMSAHFTLPLSFAVIDWHVHEQLFGYLPAVIAGFLLTAVPNWTGRLPIRQECDSRLARESKKARESTRMRWNFSAKLRGR